jgi:colicin import membrane protein
MTGSDHYRIPKEPGGQGSLVLALMVHLALLLFLWVGVSWQSHDHGGVEAEIWDTYYRESAPQASSDPEPEQDEDVVRKPKSPMKEKISKADIALEKKKKREEEKRQKLEDKKQKKAEAEIKKKEADAQRKRDEAEKKVRDKLRSDEMRRIAGATGTGGSGQAARSTGDNRLSFSYRRLIAVKIRSNTVFSVPNNLDGNPAVEYAIELLPDGSLRGRPQKLKPSGVPGFDEAVLRGIEKSAPFPPDESGKVPSSFPVIYRPKD